MHLKCLITKVSIESSSLVIIEWQILFCKTKAKFVPRNKHPIKLTVNLVNNF